MRRSPLVPQSRVRLTPSSRLLRRLAPVALLGAALGLSACQTQSPIQTAYQYNPADGVPVDLGAVQVRDLVVVSSGKDQPGVLSASVSNTSGSEQRIAFALPGTSAPVYATVAPHTVQELSGQSPTQLPKVPAAPGDVIKLTVQSGTAPVAIVDVPVITPHGYYATLNPTPESSSTTSSSSSSPSASATTH